MQQALDKLERIKQTAYAYKYDNTLSYRAAGDMYGIHYTSIANYLRKKIKPASDYYVFYQKLTLIEESVLARHSFRAYESGYPLTIQYFNDCADEFLRNRNINTIIGYHWYNSFFKRYPEIAAKYSRLIDR
jgi:hypothetical protein